MDNDMRWKWVRGFEGVYRVSDSGLIVTHCGGPGRKAGRVRKAKPNQCGYLHMIFVCQKKRETRLIHRVVAEAFIKNPRKKPWVNHKNGIKSDNRASNLEWSTPRENTIHKIRALKKANGGRPKKPVMLVETGQVFSSIKEAGRILGINPQNIGNLCAGKTKRMFNGMAFRVIQ